VSLDERPGSFGSTGASQTKIPVRSIELQSCTLTLQRGPKTLDLPLNGTLLQTPSDVAQLNLHGLLQKAALDVTGTIDGSTGKTDLSADMTALDLSSLLGLTPPAMQSALDQLGGQADVKVNMQHNANNTQTTARIRLNEAFAVGKGESAWEIRGLMSDLVLSSILPLTTPPAQAFTVRSMKLDTQELTDATVAFEVKNANDIRIANAQVNWAGGRFSAEPFTVAMSAGTVQSVVTAEHVDLAQVLAVVTQGKATGTGKLTGKVPVKYDGQRLTFGDGVLESEGGGTLRLGEAAGSLGDVLDQTDPRFASDTQMKQVKQQILEAMKDFEYDHLRANFTHTQGELVVAVQFLGRGRVGAKQPLDITLNFRGLEHGLNSYLAARARVLNSGH
jgi:hypothetical protein